MPKGHKNVKTGCGTQTIFKCEICRSTDQLVLFKNYLALKLHIKKNHSDNPDANEILRKSKTRDIMSETPIYVEDNTVTHLDSEQQQIHINRDLSQFHEYLKRSQYVKN